MRSPNESTVQYTVLGVVDDCSPLQQHEVRDQWLNVEIFCYGAELFSTLRHYSKPPMLARLLMGSPETVSAIRVLG
jgi:hypothetical protein